MADTLQASPINAARAAFARHAWRDAFERFTEADRTGTLTPRDLADHGETAWWLGRPDESLRLKERAYAGFVDAGDKQSAAKIACYLADENANGRSITVAVAWLNRAARLLEGDRESGAYAHLLLRQAHESLGEGKVEAGLAFARESLGVAERSGDRDAQALALMLTGQILVSTGDAREGMRLVDEATMAAVSGELGLVSTGIVYCATISACRDIADYRRASDWTEAAHRWCDRQSVSGFPGVCRVHRAEIIALRGGLAKAEQEARLACDELMRWNIQSIAAEGFYEIGSIRLRMGDLPAAEEAFRQAHETGHPGEPGLSLVRLAEGKAGAAHASLRSAYEQDPSRTGRARLLPALIQAAIAAGDIEAARVATAELAEIAAAFDTIAMHAALSDARGALLLAEGDLSGARHELQRALTHWQDLEAPYDAARSRVLLGRACRLAGDADAARLEFGAAKSTFERIGARRDARIAAEELGDGAAQPAEEPRVTRTFLFTDIVNSTKLVGVIGDDAWKDLMRWHDDALRSVIAQHGGEEIRHQGDGLVVSFDEPRRAVECAIAIQRRLADHRKAHGFAPPVRIGLHQTEATQRGLDYAGVGVHLAARVGALAGDGEILSTRATLEAAKVASASSGARTVELKGIADPVEIVAVDWR
jgi:class 3 adenylate cyclase